MGEGVIKELCDKEAKGEMAAVCDGLLDMAWEDIVKECQKDDNTEIVKTSSPSTALTAKTSGVVPKVVCEAVVFGNKAVEGVIKELCDKEAQGEMAAVCDALLDMAWED